VKKNLGAIKWPADHVERRSVESLIPYARNARTHSDEQVAQIAASIKEWGWTTPVLVDEDGQIIAGHGRVMAARKLGIEDIPVMIAAGWTEAQRRAYVLADNQLAANAGWDMDLLKVEIGDLSLEGFNLDLIGFDDKMLAGLLEEQTEGLTDEDAVPEVPVDPVTVLGDVWTLGRHRLMCGDSTSIDAVEKLMDGRKADMVFTDPPYGIAYKSPSGKGKTDRGNYDVILGDKQKFDPNCLFGYCDLIVTWGANHYSDQLPSSAKWLIWDKREGDAINKNSDCELAWVSEGGSARLFHHKWNGMIKASEKDQKRVHPTQKPVALVEWSFDSVDAKINILDLFGGSGSTLIACEKTARDCRMMELDPKYCDVIIKRWQDFTGQEAIHAETGKKFNDLQTR
jgi:DNA modification methylase